LAAVTSKASDEVERERIEWKKYKWLEEIKENKLQREAQIEEKRLQREVEHAKRGAEIELKATATSPSSMACRMSDRTCRVLVKKRG